MKGGGGGPLLLPIKTWEKELVSRAAIEILALNDENFENMLPEMCFL